MCDRMSTEKRGWISIGRMRSMEFVREKSQMYLGRFNKTFPAKVMHLVLFDTVHIY